MLMGAFLSLNILVTCGCSLPSFSIKTFGLVGLAVESGNKGEEVKTVYRVFDLASAMMDQGRYLNTASDLVGLGTLASLLVITVFIVPLAQAASLLAEWFAPMTVRQRLKSEAANGIFSSWQYMDVYVLSIVITAWQIGDLSEFMLNARYCGSLHETFASLSHYGALDIKDAQCFRVDATVETASWILVAAILVLGVLNHFIRAASRQKKQDDGIPDKTGRYADMLRQSKLASVSHNFARVASEEHEAVNDAGTCVSPISPRFTDFYFFATTHQTYVKNVALGRAQI
jgi:hypothetical protein